MNKVGIRALVGLFLMAEVLTPSATKAQFEPLKIYESLSFLRRIVEVATFLTEVSEEEEEIFQEAVEPPPQEPLRIAVVVTAYSSSPDETDEDPFVTAAGTMVRRGVIATNALPFGTKVKIPELFGDRVFVVEDRMHRRFRDRIDIWFPSKGEALRFGKRFAEIEIES